MTPETGRILIVEDDTGLAELLCDSLGRIGLSCQALESGADCVKRLAAERPDLLIVDHSLPDMTGVALIEALERAGTLVPFVVITGHGDEELAVRTMKLGALDYFVKDSRLLANLPDAIRRILKEVAAERRLAEAREALRESEARYRLLLAAVTDYVYSITIEDGRPVATSHGPGCIAVTGYTPEDFAANPNLWFETVTEEDRPAVAAYARAVTQGRQVDPIEHRIVRKDGSIGWVKNSFVARRDGQGRLVACDGIINDITKRKRAEELNDFLRRSIDLHEDGAYWMNREGRFVYVNESACRALGYSREELLGRSLASINADATPEMMERIWQHMREHGGFRGEAIHRRKDGTTFPVQIVASYVRYADQEFNCGFAHDITERKQAEAALARNQAELTTLYEHAPIMMLLFDGAGRAKRLNRAALDFVGVTPEAARDRRPGELLGCMHAIAAAPRDCGAAPACTGCVLHTALTASATRGASHSRLAARQRLVRNGQDMEFVLLVSTAGIEVEGERMVLLCLENVTEHKQAEERVQEQAALLEVTRDAIFVLALDDTLTFWNHGAEQIYGWSREEAVGRRLEEVFDGPLPPSIRDAIAASGEWTGELRRIGRSGGARTVQSRATLMRDAAGAPRAVLVVDTDVTEAKRLEAQFLRAQRLDSLGKLASGIAHDLNNVLAPILLGVEILRPLATTSSDRAMVEILHKSVQRGTNVVRQLLLFGRGSDEPRAAVDLGGIVTELLHIVRETFPKNIAVAVDTAKELPPVLADATQLHQVLLNLCVNARDAMPAGGILEITTGVADWDARAAKAQPGAKPGRYVVLQVADTGIGIPPGILDKIFDPFFTTKPLGSGTGLGLSTVLGIVRSHGGFVTVQSQEGVGTEFSVHLPAGAVSGDEAAPSAIRELIRGHGETVLMVEDEAAVREIMHRTLVEANYRVLPARDGAEAVALFEQRRDTVRVVVTDMMMPVLDGVETIRRLRRLDGSLPIVALSGLRRWEERIRQEGWSNIRFIAKPFEAGSLLAALHHALSSHPGPESR